MGVPISFLVRSDPQDIAITKITSFMACTSVNLYILTHSMLLESRY